MQYDADAFEVAAHHFIGAFGIAGGEVDAVGVEFAEDGGNHAVADGVGIDDVDVVFFHEVEHFAEFVVQRDVFLFGLEVGGSNHPDECT